MQNISIQTKINRRELISLALILINFFISRVVVFKFLNPFAISYLGLFLGSINFYFCALATAIGLFTKLSGIYLGKYLLSIFFMLIINIFMSGKKKLFVKAFCIFLSTIFSALLFSGGGNFILFVNIIECFLIFFLVYIFNPAFNFFYSNQTNLNTDDLISIAIVLGTTIAGTNDFYIGNLCVLNISLIFILFVIGNNYGSSYSSMFGLILGIILNLCGLINFNEIVIIAACGIFCGVFKNKLANIITLAFAAPTIIFYIQPSLMKKNLLLEFFICTALFFLLPTEFVTKKNKLENEYLDYIKNTVNYRLKSFGDSFKKLAVTFNSISEKKPSLDRKDISKLIDNIAVKTCNNCSMKKFCWENNFYDTYQTVFGILSACEKKGYVTINNIADDFRTNCVNLGKFVDTTNKLFEIYKINLAWNNKIIESRELISQQLFGVSDVINNLADELNLDMRFDNTLEEKISAALEKFNFESITAIKNKNNRYEVVINFKSHADKSTVKKISSILSNELNKNIMLDKQTFIGGFSVLKFVERQRFFVTTGVSRLTKIDSNESGDCYSVMELKNNQFALVLSDGMGSGSRAKTESVATVELFEDFMEAGFDKNIAIKMINSILVLKSNEDSFSTLDICFIDLFNGSGEFIKTGATTSFLFRDGFLQTIKSSSLPIGILNNIEYEFFSKKFRNGDIIIMMTDGVFDTIENISDKKKWLLDLLITLDSNNPQDISDYIIENAKRESKNIIKDDMTILVGRIWEKI